MGILPALPDSHAPGSVGSYRAIRGQEGGIAGYTIADGEPDIRACPYDAEEVVRLPRPVSGIDLGCVLPCDHSTSPG